MGQRYKIANWGQYQHYKKRSPPWVKLYFDLLSSETWVTGDDKTRCLMIACILAASRNDGDVPADPMYLKKIAHLNSTPDFKPLMLNGFLVASNALAECVHDASGTLATLSLSLSSGDVVSEREEKPRERDRDASKMLADRFARFWAVVTKKVGKAQSLVEFKKIGPDEELLAVMIDKARAYYGNPDVELKHKKDPERWIKGRRWEDEMGLPPQRNGSTAPARRLRVWEIPVPDEQLWAVEGRREMGQVYRDGLWVRFEDLDPDDPDYRAPEVSNG